MAPYRYEDVFPVIMIHIDYSIIKVVRWRLYIGTTPEYLYNLD